jgi:hypothetical protein
MVLVYAVMQQEYHATRYRVSSRTSLGLETNGRKTPYGPWTICAEHIDHPELLGNIVNNQHISLADIIAHPQLRWDWTLTRIHESQHHRGVCARAYLTSHGAGHSFRADSGITMNDIESNALPWELKNWSQKALT